MTAFDKFPDINGCLTDPPWGVVPTAESMRSGIADFRIHYSTPPLPSLSSDSQLKVEKYDSSGFINHTN